MEPGELRPWPGSWGVKQMSSRSLSGNDTVLGSCGGGSMAYIGDHRKNTGHTRAEICDRAVTPGDRNQAGALLKF
jgi:hypothetical protein